MKVVIINQHISDIIGGSEIQCDLIARNFQKKNHEVIYFATGPKRKEKYNDNFHYQITPVDLYNAEMLRNCLDVYKPDIIYWRFNKHKLFDTVKVIKEKSIPVVFAISAIGDTIKHIELSRVRKILKRRNLIKSLYDIAKAYYSSYYNHKAFRLIDGVTSLNSVYLGRLPVKQQVLIRNAFENNVGTASFPQTPYCVWVANLKERKRPELFIRLAEELKDTLDLKFVMVGAVQSEKYRSMVDEAIKLPNFHFLGPLEPIDVNALLSESLCLIHTCMPEGFGNNFIQAWLQGKPTLSLEFDPDGLINHYNLGKVADADFMKLKESLIALCNDNDVDSTYGERVKSFANENFSPEFMVEKLEQFMLTIIESKKDMKG